MLHAYDPTGKLPLRQRGSQFFTQQVTAFHASDDGSLQSLLDIIRGQQRPHLLHSHAVSGIVARVVYHYEPQRGETVHECECAHHVISMQ